jgi:hypothetical protein
MENHETVESSLNGVPNLGVLGREKICSTGGSSKQNTSEAICLRFKGTDVRFSKVMFQVVAYLMSQVQHAAKHDLNGTSNIADFGREESCIESAPQTSRSGLPPL